MKKVVLTISAVVLLSLLFKKRKVANLPVNPATPQSPNTTTGQQLINGALVGKQLTIVKPTLVYNNAIGLNVTVTPGEPIGKANEYNLARNEYQTTLPRYGNSIVWINASAVTG